MTNKRKVYNELGRIPKKAKTIAKATGIDLARVNLILVQLHKEGKADYRNTKAGGGWVKGSGVPPKPAPPPKPKPPEPPQPELQPSWTHPGRVMLCASDNTIADGRAGCDAIGRIVAPGVAPVWEVRDGNQQDGHLVGYIAQIEGPDQYDTAFDYLVQYPNLQRAVIGTLGVDPARMLAIGVTSYMVELNAQAGWTPYGDREALLWQCHHEGWPHALASYGVYGDVSLADYAAYKGQGCPRPFAVFSADGMGDTNSWPYLATL